MERSDNLVASFLEDSQLEMSMKELDDDSFSSDEESYEHFKAKLVTLKWLSLREKQLRISISYEKLKKEMEVIKDKDLLSDKIAVLQDELNNLNRQYINEDLKSNKIRLNEISRSIVGRKSVPAGNRIYTDKQRATIKDLLNKEKKLMKQKSTEEKEIQSIEDSRNSKRKLRTDGNEKSAELQNLRSENKLVFDRTRVLAKVTQSLVAHHLFMSPSLKTNGLLPPLQDVCERIIDSQFDDPKKLWDLLSDLKSVEI